jgi:hypothetical protein
LLYLYTAFEKQYLEEHNLIPLDIAQRLALEEVTVVSKCSNLLLDYIAEGKHVKIEDFTSNKKLDTWTLSMSKNEESDSV